MTFLSLQDTGASPLGVAAFSGNMAVIAALLKNGADANQDSMLPPLHNAAKHGHDAVVDILLSYGANVNKVDYDGSSPLHCAAESGHDTVVTILIKMGADVNQVDHDGDRPIDVAKTQKIKDMLIALTEEKREGQAAVSKVVDEAQWFRAAKKGKLAVIQQGINDKIDVNCLDSTGRTALYWATENDHLLLVEYLLSQHADASILSSVSANDIF